jgi:hypothetical protein
MEPSGRKRRLRKPRFGPRSASAPVERRCRRFLPRLRRPSWLGVRVEQRVEPSLDRLLLDLRTSRGDRRSERLQRRGVSGISLQLPLVPTVQRQALARAREQLGRHARRRERDSAALLEQSGDANAGGVEIENSMEARVGLELGEAAHQRNLGRRRPAGDPDDQVGAPVTSRVNTPPSCTTTTGAGENRDLLARKSCVLVCVITVSRPRVTP